LSLVIDAALLQRSAYETLSQQPTLALWCLLIPFLAGASEMAGQAFVLAERRVHPAHAAASFLLTGLVYVAAVALWTAAAYAFLQFDGLRSPDTTILGIIAVGYAPRLLSVLTIAPYYGELFGRALDAWSMVCVGWGLSVVTGGPIPMVMLCTSLGWLGSFLVRHYAGRAIGPLLNRIGVVTAGAARA
jgi:hypothetical protein